MAALRGRPSSGGAPSSEGPAPAGRPEPIGGAPSRLRGSAGEHPRFALLVPGASCASRRYPAARFGAAAAGIAAAGLPVLVSGTAAEAGLVEQVVRAADAPDVRALPATALPVFTALVARAAVALVNNSGGLHLADAVGTPVVANVRGNRTARRRRPAGGAVRAAAGPDAVLALPGSSPVRSTSSASTSRRSGSSPRHSG